MMNHISDEKFLKWTQAWQALEVNPGGTDLDGLFKYQKNSQTLFLRGVFLNSSEVEALLSATGVTTIKVRFGLCNDDDCKNDRFKVLLFGTDNLGERYTPYYVHAIPEFRETGSDGSPHGNVPNALVKKWCDYWTDFEGKPITGALFLTHFGFLRGYNYAVKELIDSLFKFQAMPELFVRFVLHRYRATEMASRGSQDVYTFGLLFQAILSDGDKAGLLVGDADDSGYYDLSAPCPRTC